MPTMWKSVRKQNTGKKMFILFQRRLKERTYEMKKISLLAILLAIVVLFAACGTTAQNSVAETELKLYKTLNTIYSAEALNMQYILRAWEFTNSYSNSSYYDDYEYWKAYAKELSMSKNDIKEGIRLILPNAKVDSFDDKTLSQCLRVLDCAITVAANKINKGTSETITSLMTDAKTYLKEIKGKSEAYETFQDYYIMICEMNDWTTSPSGTYVSSSAKFSGYNNKASAYQRELQFIVE